MSDVQQTVPQLRPWKAAIASFLTCLIAGPPVGGIVFALMLAFWPWLQGLLGDGADLTLQYRSFVGLVALIVGLPLAYVAGGVQAALAGLAFAAYGLLAGRPPAWFAFALAIAIYPVTRLLGIGGPMLFVKSDVAVHVIPVIVCWMLIRPFWKASAA
jgi:hypothetical protein